MDGQSSSVVTGQVAMVFINSVYASEVAADTHSSSQSNSEQGPSRDDSRLTGRIDINADSGIPLEQTSVMLDERYYWNMLTPALRHFDGRVGDHIGENDVIRLHLSASRLALDKVNTQQLNLSVDQVVDGTVLASVVFLEKLLEREQFRQALSRFGSAHLETIIETFYPEYLTDIAAQIVTARLRFASTGDIT